MRRARPRLPSQLVAGGLALACGDPKDIEIAWAPRVAERETLPVFSTLPARAFAQVEIGPGSERAAAACSVRFKALLGQSCAQLDTPNADCTPVADGEGATVACSVRPLVEAPGVYDVWLTLLDGELLPRLAVEGPLNESRTTRVSLQVTTLDEIPVEAHCSAESLFLQPGAARLRLAACEARVADVDEPGCDVSVVADFERCAGLSVRR